LTFDILEQKGKRTT